MTIDSEVDKILKSAFRQYRDMVENYRQPGEIRKDAAQAITNLIAQETNKARLDELNLAVQQYIHTTKSNPDNFSDYAHHRIQALTAEKG